jgi:hypothetical protein
LSAYNLPVLCAHALDASTDTDVDHAGADLVGNVNAGLQTRRALAVERADGRRLGEASNQRSSTHLSSTATRGEHGTDADILDEGGVELRALDDGLQHAGDEVSSLGVLEAALATLGECAAARGGNNDLCGIVSVHVSVVSSVGEYGEGTYIVGALLEDLVATAGGGVARQLAAELSDSVLSCKVDVS